MEICLRSRVNGRRCWYHSFTHSLSHSFIHYVALGFFTRSTSDLIGHGPLPSSLLRTTAVDVQLTFHFTSDVPRAFVPAAMLTRPFARGLLSGWCTMCVATATGPNPLDPHILSRSRTSLVACKAKRHHHHHHHHHELNLNGHLITSPATYRFFMLQAGGILLNA